MTLQPGLWPFSREPVALDVLKALSPAYLCRLLGLFGTAAMFCRDAIQKDVAAGIASLHTALNATIATLPETLSKALNAIGDLSSEAGRQQVLLALESEGKPPPHAITASDLALQTYLDHPAAFDVAYGWAASRGARRYAVFAGPRGPMIPSSSSEVRSRLAAAVGEWLALLLGHSRFDVRIDEATGKISVLVLYQRGGLEPRARTLDQGTRFLSLPELNALATYHSQCGLLCVRAENLSEHHAYRRVFGRALFGEENWFQIRDVFTIDPLLERGIEALSADGMRGVQSTFLRGVEVVAPERDHLTVELTADNLSSSDLNSSLVQAALARGTISSMSLALSLSGFPRPLFAKIAPPNGLVLSGQFAQKEIARDFLVARGFMRLSMPA